MKTPLETKLVAGTAHCFGHRLPHVDRYERLTDWFNDHATVYVSAFGGGWQGQMTRKDWDALRVIEQNPTD